MSQLGDLLRETVRNTTPEEEEEPNTNSTIIGLLRERMEVTTALQPNPITTSTSQLKQRFRIFKPNFCCGSGFEDNQVAHVDSDAPDQSPPPNLAAALDPERQMVATPGRVSLMRLLEEAAWEKEERERGGSDRVCCVCMGREKGAALIPCGHTFCRVCSREVWVNRGFCPLCNRSILDVLDIF